MGVIEITTYKGMCKKCIHLTEFKTISSIVFQNSPCFTCLFNEEMIRGNNFIPRPHFDDDGRDPDVA